MLFRSVNALNKQKRTELLLLGLDPLVTLQNISCLQSETADLTGPRPVTIDRPLETYDEKRKIRLKVRPGITGFSQAYFRNSISNEEKLEKDAVYAEHVTFSGDLKIILATIRTVLFHKNIYNSCENER